MPCTSISGISVCSISLEVVPFNNCTFRYSSPSGRGVSSDRTRNLLGWEFRMAAPLVPAQRTSYVLLRYCDLMSCTFPSSTFFALLMSEILSHISSTLSIRWVEKITEVPFRFSRSEEHTSELQSQIRIY